jgi:hypothetical protein
LVPGAFNLIVTFFAIVINTDFCELDTFAETNHLQLSQIFFRKVCAKNDRRRRKKRR